MGLRLTTSPSSFPHPHERIPLPGTCVLGLRAMNFALVSVCPLRSLVSNGAIEVACVIGLLFTFSTPYFPHPNEKMPPAWHLGSGLRAWNVAILSSCALRSLVSRGVVEFGRVICLQLSFSANSFPRVNEGMESRNNFRQDMVPEGCQWYD